MEYITVFDTPISSVVANGEQCTSIAFSFGIHCICKQVARLVIDQHNENRFHIETSLTDDTPSVTASIESTSATPSVSVDRVAIACQKLDVMKAALLKGDGVLNCSQDVFKAIDHAYATMFRPNYKKKTKKSKIEPNSSCRRLIEQSLKRHKTHEHGYSLANNKRKIRKNINRPDGSFRRIKPARSTVFD